MLDSLDRLPELPPLGARLMARWRQDVPLAAAPTGAYARDPVAWVQERTRGFLWSKQQEIARAVAAHRRVAVPSAYDMGKSFTAARLIAWWLDPEVHPRGEAFAVTTATTYTQVRAILWRELRRAHVAAQLPGRLNQTEWYLDGELVAMGRKPSDYNPEGFQGIHARYVLVVIDEAAGVPESIFRAANSLAANEHCRILAIGNPDDPGSYFASICQPDSGWHVITVNGLASPNFTDEPIPDGLRDLLLSRTYEQELRNEVGADSPVYISKIEGRFPESAEDAVIPLAWVRACQRLDLQEANADWPNELGMDVGAGGDETTLYHRLGPVAGQHWAKRTPDFADAVLLALEALDTTQARTIKIDTVGIGWGVVGRLQELRREGRHQADVIGVNVGQASTAPEKYPKFRDQLWWEVGRELSRSGGWDLAAIDEATVAQLIAPRYRRDAANRIQVEPKLETRKRLRRSPDQADALLLAFCHPPGPGIPHFF